MVKKKEARAYPGEENGSFYKDSLDSAIAASVRSPLPQHDFLARKTPELHSKRLRPVLPIVVCDGRHQDWALSSDYSSSVKACQDQYISILEH